MFFISICLYVIMLASYDWHTPKPPVDLYLIFEKSISIIEEMASCHPIGLVLQKTSFSSKEQTWLDLFWSVLICLDLIWYVCFGLGKFKFHNGNSQNVLGSYFKVQFINNWSVFFIGIVRQVGNLHTGISRFPLIMWGHKRKTAEAKTA